MSDTVANLSVGIDGSAAIAGERVVRRALDGIKQSAASTMSQLGHVSGALRSLGMSSESGIRVVKRSFDEFNKSASIATTSAGNFKNQVLSIGAAAVGVYGVVTAFAKVREYARDTIQYLAKIETATLGIAASFLVSGQYTDKLTGQVIKGDAALRTSMLASKQVIDQLRIANYQTAATLDELIFAYEVTLPVAMAKGFDKQQVMDFTLAMVQAAGSIGLAYDQIAEETRSLLTGNVTRNSRIAQILGLNNNQEYLAKAKEGGDALFNYLDKRLQGFKLAGREVMNTWDGIWSNFKDIARQSSGYAFEGLFDGIKDQTKALMDYIAPIDVITKRINWNPEFITGIIDIQKNVNDLFASLVSGVKYIYDHKEAIKLLAELYVKYKITILAASVTTKIYIATIGKITAAKAEHIAMIQRENAAEMQRIASQNGGLTARQKSIIKEREEYAAITQLVVAKKNQATMNEVYATAAHENNIRQAVSLHNVAKAELEAMEASQRRINIDKANSAFRKTMAQQEFLNAKASVTATELKIKAILAEQATLRKTAIANMGTGTFAWSGKGSADPGKMQDLIRQQAALEKEKAAAIETSNSALKRYRQTTLAYTVTQQRSNVMDSELIALGKAKQNSYNLQSMALGKLTQVQQVHLHQNVLTARTLATNTALEEAHALALAMNDAMSRKATAGQLALNAARTAGAAVMTLLGGWIGLITIALVAGAWAWSKWGNAAEEAKNKAKEAAQSVLDAARSAQEQLRQLSASSAVEDAMKGGRPATQEEKDIDMMGIMDYQVYKNSLERQKQLLKDYASDSAQILKLENINAKREDDDYDDADRNAQIFRLKERQTFLQEQLKMEKGASDELYKAKKDIQEKMNAIEFFANERTQNQADLDKALAAQKRLLDALAALKSSQYELDRTVLQSSLNEELRALQISYDRKLIAGKEYFMELARIEKESVNNQLTKVGNEITDQRSVVSQLSNNKNKGEKSGKIIAEEQTKLNVLLTKQAELKDKLATIDSRTSVSIFNNQIKQKKGLEDQSIEIANIINDKSELARINTEGINASERMMELETELTAAQRAGNIDRIADAMNALNSFKAIAAYKMEAAQAEAAFTAAVANAQQITNPYKKEMEIAKATSDYKIRLLNAEKDLRIKAGKSVVQSEQQIANESANFAQITYQKTLAEVGKYTSVAASMFSTLAQAQDQSSRDGFEAAKMFNIAATVMNTATAIMGQLTTPGPLGWAGAAAAAAAGAVQLASIQSTSFEGGGSIVDSSNFQSAGGGTGKVLGDKNAKTMSISDSNDYLEELNAQQYNELKNIYQEMKDLNQNITGLASNLVRSFGEFGKENISGVKLGTESNFLGGNGNWLVNGDNAITEIFFDKISGMLGKLPFGEISSGLMQLGGAIPSLINTVVNWIGDGVFGKTKKEISASGLDLSLGGAQQYTTVKTKTKSWFDSDTDYDTYYGELNSKASELIKDILTGMTDTISLMAAEADITTDLQPILEKAFDIGLVDLSGLTGAEISEKLMNVFSFAMDDAVEAIFPDLVQKYQDIGETATNAVLRVFSEKAMVMDSFAAIGLDVSETTRVAFSETAMYAEMMSSSFSFVRKSAEYLADNMTTVETDFIAVTQAIINFSGGAEKFQENFANYMDAFFTDDQKFDRLESQLQNALDMTGLDLPETREGFIKLVDSMDAITESGQRGYASLMAAAEAAGIYYQTIEDGAKLQAEAKKREREAFADLAVRELVAKGDNAGADTLSKALDRRREEESAYAEGLSKSYIAELRRVRALEDEAEALRIANELTEARARANEDIQVRLLKGLGDSTGSAALSRKINGMRETESAIENNLGEAYIIKLRYVLELEDKAAADADKLKEVSDKFNEVSSDLKKAYDEESKAMQKTIDTFQKFADSLRKFRQDLEIGSAAANSPESQYYKTKELFQDTFNKAMTGDEQALTDLESVSKAYLDASKNYYASTEPYFADLNAVKRSVESAEKIAMNRVSMEQQNLDALTEQVGQLITLNETTLSIKDAIEAFNSAKTANDDVINAQNATQTGVWNTVSDGSQIKVSNTGTVSTISAEGNRYFTDKNGATESAVALSQYFAGMIDKGQFATLYQQAKDAGATAADLSWISGHTESYYNNLANLAGLPSFAVGTSRVDKDMTANIHEGEMIVDRASADALRRYGVNTNTSSGNNKGVEERLDKVVAVLGDVERRLARIDNKARLVANA